MSAGERAWWDREADTTSCERCRTPTPAAVVDRRAPGASVRRDPERRRYRPAERDERRFVADEADPVRDDGDRLPEPDRARRGVTTEAVAVRRPSHFRTEEPRQASEGVVTTVLDRTEGIVVLHDRLVSGGRASVEHLAVTPSGVWIIEAQRYAGQRVAACETGGPFRREQRLLVDGRDRTRLVDAVAGQAGIVAGAIGDRTAETVVRPVLCFVDAAWPWLARPFLIRGVTICWPEELPLILTRPGRLGPPAVQGLAATVAERLPAL